MYFIPGYKESVARQKSVMISQILAMDLQVFAFQSIGGETNNCDIYCNSNFFVTMQEDLQISKCQRKTCFSFQLNGFFQSSLLYLEPAYYRKESLVKRTLMNIFSSAAMGWALSHRLNRIGLRSSLSECHFQASP